MITPATARVFPLLRRAPLPALLGLAAVLVGPGSADAGATSCITGSDGEIVEYDEEQIRELRRTIEATCDCASFTGSGPGTGRADYKRCVKDAVRSAVLTGDLRNRCRTHGE